MRFPPATSGAVRKVKNPEYQVSGTNAFEITDNDLAVRTIDTAMGVVLQKAAPKAHVVKALNSVWYRTMADPEAFGTPITIPIAGNNAASKENVTKLLNQIGFEAVDVGPIEYSEQIEGMLIVWMNARLNGHAFNYYFRPEDD